MNSQDQRALHGVRVERGKDDSRTSRGILPHLGLLASAIEIVAYFIDCGRDSVFYGFAIYKRVLRF